MEIPEPTQEVAKGAGEAVGKTAKSVADCRSWGRNAWISGCLPAGPLLVACAAPAGLLGWQPPCWGRRGHPPIPIAPLPATTPGLALWLWLTGLSAPATRRKLFELARAFSEKTRMRKSKRKHLSKHQSYPFRPGAGWGRGC